MICHILFLGYVTIRHVNPKCYPSVVTHTSSHLITLNGPKNGRISYFKRTWIPVEELFCKTHFSSPGMLKPLSSHKMLLAPWRCATDLVTATYYYGLHAYADIRCLTIQITGPWRVAMRGGSVVSWDPMLDIRVLSAQPYKYPHIRHHQHTVSLPSRLTHHATATSISSQ